MLRRKLTAKDVAFSLSCEPEDIPFVGNCSAISDDIDRQTEDWIAEQLEGGNAWAWCQVLVTARWNGFQGRAALGGCSYESEESFRRPGGYFDDLKAEALDALNDEVERAAYALDSLIS